MSQRMRVALAAMLVALCSWTASAQDTSSSSGAKSWQTLPPDAQAALQEKWDGMSPEEQADFVQQAKDRRAKFDKLSPEKQREIMQRRDQRRKDWAGMSDEERRAAIQDQKEHRGDIRDQWQGMSEEERDAW